MSDTYGSFSELARGETEGRDWVRFHRDRDSSFLVMAPHGGWIEPYTTELAQAIAGEDLSFYTFQGLKKGGNRALHLTSHRFDEPLALAAASQADHVVAIHGERSGGDVFVMVGGGGAGLRDAIAGALRGAGFSIVEPRRGLGGRNPGNICNRGRLGPGVQLEISEGLRAQLRERPKDQARFVASVRKVLLEKESEVSADRPLRPQSFRTPVEEGVYTMDFSEKLRWVDEALREVANPQRKVVTSGYFPTSMEILGVPAPEIRKVVRQLHKEMKEGEPAQILDLCHRLAEWGTHEGRQVGYEFLDRRKDARALVGTMAVRRLGKGIDNWASVDAFGVLVAGPIWREGQIPDREVLRWTTSKDRWWRRTALVSTIPLNLPSRGGVGDSKRTLVICRALSADPEPMVAKALSWAVRTLIRVDPEGVEAFLEEASEMLPALVLREVRNKLATGRKNPGGPSPRGSRLR